MSEQDSSTSASQTEGEVEEEMDGEMEGEGEQDKKDRDSPTPSLSSFSSTLYAVIRIKQKYQAMKKRRQELGLGGDGPLTGAGSQCSPWEGPVPQRKKRRRRNRVLYPNRGSRRAPPKQAPSKAKYCLYLLCAIVFIQVKCVNTTQLL